MVTLALPHIISIKVDALLNITMYDEPLPQSSMQIYAHIYIVAGAIYKGATCNSNKPSGTCTIAIAGMQKDLCCYT